MSAPAEPLNLRFLETAIDAVRRAGDIQLSRFGTDVQVNRKGTIDLVTEVDLAVEAMVRALIAERFPDHRVLAEEAGLGDRDDGTTGGYCWVFDPLDGTTNFIHGLPIFCSSLALERDGVALVGAVLNPTRDELFTAVRGGGASLNGSPIRVSSTASLIDAMLCTGFPYTVHEEGSEIVGLFGHFVGRARAVRRLGSAAIDLCYVAAGRLDGFWERGLHPWDIAAGALIVQEAGGGVSRFDGLDFTSQAGDVIASNGMLHAAMLDTVASYRSRSRNETI